MNRVIFMTAVSFIGLTSLSFASGTDADSMANNTPAPAPATVSLYQQGLDASKANDFQKALPLFQQALAADPNNPDILNELAHSQRKLGHTDEAIDNYKKALAIKPKFAEAREYLGEAYVQAAMEQADTLKGYGKDGEEELEDLSHDIKDAASKV